MGDLNSSPEQQEKRIILERVGNFYGRSVAGLIDTLGGDGNNQVILGKQSQDQIRLNPEISKLQKYIAKKDSEVQQRAQKVTQYRSAYQKKPDQKYIVAIQKLSTEIKKIKRTVSPYKYIYQILIFIISSKNLTFSDEITFLRKVDELLSQMGNFHSFFENDIKSKDEDTRQKRIQYLKLKKLGAKIFEISEDDLSHKIDLDSKVFMYGLMPTLRVIYKSFKLKKSLIIEDKFLEYMSLKINSSMKGNGDTEKFRSGFIKKVKDSFKEYGELNFHPKRILEDVISGEVTKYDGLVKAEILLSLKRLSHDSHSIDKFISAILDGYKMYNPKSKLDESTLILFLYSFTIGVYGDNGIIHNDILKRKYFESTASHIEKFILLIDARLTKLGLNDQILIPGFEDIQQQKNEDS